MGSQSALSVAVVIPSLHSPLVADVVKAVRAQAHAVRDLDVVVVGLADSYPVECAGARFVPTTKPVSAAAARNLGAAATAADVLIFLDSDCLPETGWLDSMIRALTTERVVVCGAIHVVPDSFIRMAGNVASFHEFTSALRRSERQFLASFSLGLSRSAFKAVTGFDERCPRSGGEDLDLTIRLRQAGYRLWFEPAVRVVHRPSRTTLSSVWSHGIRAGANSIAVRRRYPEIFRMPRALFFWPLLMMSCPILVAVVTLRALIRNPDVRGNPKALPVLVISRLAWVAGAARALRRNEVWLPIDEGVDLPMDGSRTPRVSRD